MKKLIVFTAFIFGLVAAPALAVDSTASKLTKVDDSVASYVKKDKAYWTRVWYQKQAAKGRRYKTASYAKKQVRKKRRSYSSGRVLAKVDLSSQTMRVYKGGSLVHTWKVSTGRSGYGTPTGTWNIHRMHKRYFSRKYNGAPMPYAMFYNRGFAVHGTGSVSRLGRRASHGCVRLHPTNAAKLFSMVKRSGGTVKVVY